MQELQSKQFDLDKHFSFSNLTHHLVQVKFKVPVQLHVCQLTSTAEYDVRQQCKVYVKPNSCDEFARLIPLNVSDVDIHRSGPTIINVQQENPVSQVVISGNLISFQIKLQGLHLVEGITQSVEDQSLATYNQLPKLNLLPRRQQQYSTLSVGSSAVPCAKYPSAVSYLFQCIQGIARLKDTQTVCESIQQYANISNEFARCACLALDVVDDEPSQAVQLMGPLNDVGLVLSVENGNDNFSSVDQVQVQDALDALQNQSLSVSSLVQFVLEQLGTCVSSLSTKKPRDRGNFVAPPHLVAPISLVTINLACLLCLTIEGCIQFSASNGTYLLYSALHIQGLPSSAVRVCIGTIELLLRSLGAVGADFALGLLPKSDLNRSKHAPMSKIEQLDGFHDYQQADDGLARASFDDCKCQSEVTRSMFVAASNEQVLYSKSTLNSIVQLEQISNSQLYCQMTNSVDAVAVPQVDGRDQPSDGGRDHKKSSKHKQKKSRKRSRSRQRSRSPRINHKEHKSQTRTTGFNEQAQEVGGRQRHVEDMQKLQNSPAIAVQATSFALKQRVDQNDDISLAEGKPSKRGRHKPRDKEGDKDRARARDKNVDQHTGPDRARERDREVYRDRADDKHKQKGRDQDPEAEKGASDQVFLTRGSQQLIDSIRDIDDGIGIQGWEASGGAKHGKKDYSSGSQATKQPSRTPPNETRTPPGRPGRGALDASPKKYSRDGKFDLRQVLTAKRQGHTPGTDGQAALDVHRDRVGKRELSALADSSRSPGGGLGQRGKGAPDRSPQVKGRGLDENDRGDVRAVESPYDSGREGQSSKGHTKPREDAGEQWREPRARRVVDGGTKRDGYGAQKGSMHKQRGDVEEGKLGVQQGSGGAKQNGRVQPSSRSPVKHGRPARGQADNAENYGPRDERYGRGLGQARGEDGGGGQDGQRVRAVQVAEQQHGPRERDERHLNGASGRVGQFERGRGGSRQADEGPAPSQSRGQERDDMRMGGKVRQVGSQQLGGARPGRPPLGDDFDQGSAGFNRNKTKGPDQRSAGEPSTYHERRHVSQTDRAGHDSPSRGLPSSQQAQHYMEHSQDDRYGQRSGGEGPIPRQGGRVDALGPGQASGRGAKARAVYSQHGLEPGRDGHRMGKDSTDRVIERKGDVRDDRVEQVQPHRSREHKRGSAKSDGAEKARDKVRGYNLYGPLAAQALQSVQQGGRSAAGVAKYNGKSAQRVLRWLRLHEIVLAVHCQLNNVQQLGEELLTKWEALGIDESLPKDEVVGFDSAVGKVGQEMQRLISLIPQQRQRSDKAMLFAEGYKVLTQRVDVKCDFVALNLIAQRGILSMLPTVTAMGLALHVTTCQRGNGGGTHRASDGQGGDNGLEHSEQLGLLQLLDALTSMLTILLSSAEGMSMVGQYRDVFSELSVALTSAYPVDSEGQAESAEQIPASREEQSVVVHAEDGDAAKAPEAHTACDSNVVVLAHDIGRLLHTLLSFTAQCERVKSVAEKSALRKELGQAILDALISMNTGSHNQVNSPLYAWAMLNAPGVFDTLTNLFNRWATLAQRIAVQAENKTIGLSGSDAEDWTQLRQLPQILAQVVALPQPVLRAAWCGQSAKLMKASDKVVRNVSEVPVQVESVFIIRGHVGSMMELQEKGPGALMRSVADIVAGDFDVIDMQQPQLVEVCKNLMQNGEYAHMLIARLTCLACVYSTSGISQQPYQSNLHSAHAAGMQVQLAQNTSLQILQKALHIANTCFTMRCNERTWMRSTGHIPVTAQLPGAPEDIAEQQTDTTQPLQRAVALLPAAACAGASYVHCLACSGITLHFTALLASLLTAYCHVAWSPQTLAAARQLPPATAEHTSPIHSTSSTLQVRTSLAASLAAWALYQCRPAVLPLLFTRTTAALDAPFGRDDAAGCYWLGEPSKLHPLLCLLGDMLPREWPPASGHDVSVWRSGLAAIPYRQAMAGCLERVLDDFKELVRQAVTSESSIVRALVVRLCCRAAGLGAGVAPELAAPLLADVNALDATSLSTRRRLEVLGALVRTVGMRAGLLAGGIVNIMSKLISNFSSVCDAEGDTGEDNRHLCKLAIDICEALYDWNISLNALLPDSRKQIDDVPTLNQSSKLISTLLVTIPQLHEAAPFAADFLAKLSDDVAGAAALHVGAVRYVKTQDGGLRDGDELLGAEDEDYSSIMQQCVSMIKGVAEVCLVKVARDACMRAADVFEKMSSVPVPAPLNATAQDSFEIRYARAVREAQLASKQNATEPLEVTYAKLINTSDTDLSADQALAAYWQHMERDIVKSGPEPKVRSIEWQIKTVKPATSVLGPTLNKLTWHASQARTGVYKWKNGVKSADENIQEEQGPGSRPAAPPSTERMLGADIPTVIAPPSRHRLAAKYRQQQGSSSTRPSSIHVDTYTGTQPPEQQQPAAPAAPAVPPPPSVPTQHGAVQPKDVRALFGSGGDKKSGGEREKGGRGRQDSAADSADKLSADVGGRDHGVGSYGKGSGGRSRQPRPPPIAPGKQEDRAPGVARGGHIPATVPMTKNQKGSVQGQQRLGGGVTTGAQQLGDEDGVGDDDLYGTSSGQFLQQANSLPKLQPVPSLSLEDDDLYGQELKNELNPPSATTTAVLSTPQIQPLQAPMVQQQVHVVPPNQPMVPISSLATGTVGPVGQAVAELPAIQVVAPAQPTQVAVQPIASQPAAPQQQNKGNMMAQLSDTLKDPVKLAALLKSNPKLAAILKQKGIKKTGK